MLPLGTKKHATSWDKNQEGDENWEGDKKRWQKSRMRRKKTLEWHKNQGEKKNHATSLDKKKSCNL